MSAGLMNGNSLELWRVFWRAVLFSSLNQSNQTERVIASTLDSN